MCVGVGGAWGEGKTGVLEPSISFFANRAFPGRLRITLIIGTVGTATWGQQHGDSNMGTATQGQQHGDSNMGTAT